VFPKAERISIDLKPEEFRGVWPDRHTYEACMRDFRRAWRAKEQGDPIPMRGLMQEYYLRISNDDDRMIQDGYISWYKRQTVIDNAWNYNWYITTDFTTTAGSGSDLAGIALWAVSWSGDWFLVDLKLKKMEVEEQYRAVFDMVRSTVGNVRTSVEVGVEIDGQQSLHLMALRERMTENNIYFAFARQKGAKIGSEGIRSRLEGGNKHWRFRLMLPMFQNHKIHFPKELKETPDMRELMEEIKYVTYSGFGSKHDDGIDLISQIGLIDARYPPKVVEEKPNKYSPEEISINKKIWGRDTSIDDEDTVYDSYA
jgi:phage terminase large subunit-like protein